MFNAILVDEAEDLGSGNFRVRLRIGDGDNQLSHADIVTAPSCEAAVEKAKEDFSRWLRMTFDVATKMTDKSRP